MRILPNLGVAGLLLATLTISTGLAFANDFSFTGSFTADDQLQSFTFTLASSSIIVARTFGYAGGTNAANTDIPAGGFDPWLSLFDSSGNLLASVDNGACGLVGTDPATGSCFDSYISQSLGAGDYTLILSESDNQPVGNFLSDGFTRTGQGDFTASAFGCTIGPFCDVNASNRTSAWAVDIDNVTSAGGPSSVPEPALTFPWLLSFVALALIRRRRAR